MNEITTFQPNQGQLDTLKGLGMEEQDRRKFIQNLGTLILNNKSIAECDVNSVFNVALSLTKLNLFQETGTGYIVPYNTRDGKKAQLQIGYKGYVELAMRTGLYEKIDCVEVKESDYVSYDIDSDTYTWSDKELSFQEVIDRKKEPTFGYRAFAITHSGDKQEMFMTMEEIEAHHSKFSNAYKSRDKFGNIFNTNKDAMDRKVVLKLFINRKLVKSLDPLQSNDLIQGLKLDSAVIDKNLNPHYIDNPNDSANKRIKITSKEELEDGTKVVHKSNQNGDRDITIKTKDNVEVKTDNNTGQSVETIDGSNIDYENITFNKGE